MQLRCSYDVALPDCVFLQQKSGIMSGKPPIAPILAQKVSRGKKYIV